MKKYLNKKNLTIISIFIIILAVFVKLNFYKFYSIYFTHKYNYTKNIIEGKNLKLLEIMDDNKIFFEKDEYKFQKFPLEKYGVFFKKKYIHRPVGYFDVYMDRIIFVSYDGTIFYSNNIDEIKNNNNLIFKKFKTINLDLEFDEEDNQPYRNIKIRDILIDDDKLYLVTNGRTKLSNDNYYGSTNILYGNINLNSFSIKIKKFYSPDEKIFNIGDWAHSGGRLVKYKNSSFLLAVPDYALKIDSESFAKLIKSDESIIGKILLIKDGKSKTFSYGHRNPQGLFYDQENDLIFETEHGPTGGDEINLIKYKKNYGWPDATYGAKIQGLNKFRNHKKNGYVEPLKYWWPANCAQSEIIKVDKNFNYNWKKYTLISACLSGSKNQGESIYRWEFDPKKEKLIKKNKYYIGDRIRDIKYLKEKKIILMLLENQKSLVLIFK